MQEHGQLNNMIQGLLEQIAELHPVIVDIARQRVEASPLGQYAIKSTKNRRLYAMLKPTPEENLFRIKAVFDGLPEDYLRILLCQAFEQAMPGYLWASRIFEEYNGRGQAEKDRAHELLSVLSLGNMLAVVPMDIQCAADDFKPG